MVEDPLTAFDIQFALKHAWPNVVPATTSFVTGTTTKLTIWKFVIEITLTTNPVVFGETPGSVRMAFTFSHGNLKPIVIKKSFGNEIAVVKAFIQYCKAYLNGIAAEIERAGEPERESPESDIFK